MTDLFNPSPEHRALRELVRSFVEREVDPQAEASDHAERFNIALFRKLGELGLLGITVEERFGGSGLDPVAVVIAHEEISAADPGFALAFLAHSILFANNLQINGSDAQRAQYLPIACTGEKVCGMCMSEPSAGTDVLGMQTSAVRKGEVYVLNGAKMWITNGAVSDSELGDVFLVYARVEGQGRNQLSMFIVEKGFQGFSLGQKIKGKLGMRASMTAELVFEDCEVPVENLVGEEGTATLHMMRNLEIERVALAGMSLGIARRSLEVMNRYANERSSFGKPLREFGQIQRYIAQSYAEFMAGRAYTYHTAATMSLETPGQRLDSDGVKLFTSTMGKDIADRAIQVLGGYGYVSEYGVERLWRDAKLLEIGGGTLEAHQKNMCRELSRVERIL
ncbi:MAG: acyl-CoA dehydrogenase family protein [Myxococcales bacterium]|nr:acyl-CoA dehydrogenase family protein [Myxococcales bacterium]MDH3482697.1 acyl-CoA dehydrogenase family protein [Myxococcales bacterium]